MTMQFGVPAVGPSLAVGVPATTAEYTHTASNQGPLTPHYVYGQTAGSFAVAYVSSPALVVAASDAPAALRDVADYVCDGTDDHVEIQAAIASATTNLGFAVLLSGGNFLGGQLELPSGISLTGMGLGATTYKLANATNSHAVVNDDAATGNSNITLREITFDFNGANQSAGLHGIRLDRVTNFWMDGCELKNASAHNIASVTPSAGFNSRFFISNCLSTGAGVQGTGDGFRIKDGVTQACDGGQLVNCVANGNSNHGIHIGLAGQAINCSSDNNEQSSFTLDGNFAQLIGGNATNVDPSGDATTHSITVQTGLHCRVIGCYVSTTGVATSDGIRVAAGADNAIIEGNTVIDGLRDGIRISADNCVVTGNQVSGNASRQIGDDGSGNIVRYNKGHVTEASGTGSITSGGTTDVITHGLAITPTIDDVAITLGENPSNTPGAIWVDTFTSTQFTVNCENDPGASNLDFGWSARA